MKALEAAQKGIAQEEPDKINDVSYLQSIVDELQTVAQKLVNHER